MSPILIVILVFGSFSVELELYRQACRHHMKDEKRPAFDLSMEEEDFLRNWYISKLDDLHFTAAYSSATTVAYNNSGTFTVGSSAATAIAAVDATNSKITPALISQAKVIAKTGNGGAAYRIEPIRVNGMELYVLVVSEDTMYDLKSNSAMQQAQREALERGKDNPLFRAGDLLWDGVLITSCERVASGTNASSVPYAHNLLLGKGALLQAWGKKFNLVEESFDYGAQMGTAGNMFLGVSKAAFVSKDKASISLITARRNISGS